MKHTRKKSKGMTKHILILPVFLAAVVALVLVAAAPLCWAGNWHHHDDDGDEIPFEEAEIFFELNDTDGDLGIHALIDGEPWKKVEIEAPDEREILTIWTQSRLRRQGLTELFFESAEYPFESDDPEEVTLSPERFFRRFPAGTYEIEGRTLEGEELESEVEVTHMMPAPPEFTITDGTTTITSDDECADPEEDEPLPVLNGDVTVTWDPVENSHEDIGLPRDSKKIKIVLYQVVAECENDELLTFSMDVPPSKDPMSVTVPAAFFGDGEDLICKIEVLAREESHNQTSAESCPFNWAEAP